MQSTSAFISILMSLPRWVYILQYNSILSWLCHCCCPAFIIYIDCVVRLPYSIVSPQRKTDMSLETKTSPKRISLNQELFEPKEAKKTQNNYNEKKNHCYFFLHILVIFWHDYRSYIYKNNFWNITLYLFLHNHFLTQEYIMHMFTVLSITQQKHLIAISFHSYASVNLLTEFWGSF